MIERKSSHRTECVHFAEHIQPMKKTFSIFFSPRFDTHHLAELPKQRSLQEDVHNLVVSQVQFVQFGSQFLQYFGSSFPIRAELCFEAGEQWCFHLLPVNERNEFGINGKDAELFVVYPLQVCDVFDKPEARHHKSTERKPEPTH